MKYTLKQLFESKDDFDYLKSINAKSLSKGQRPPKGVSPKDFYKDLKTKIDQEAEQGPIFDQNVLSNVLEIETEVPQNVLQWIGNQIKDGQKVNLSDNNLTRLLNYLSVEDTDLKTTSYADVADDLEHTVYDTDFKSFGKYSVKDIVYSFKDGWTIVKVGSQDASIEGEEMQNCIGDYCDSIKSGNSTIYSLRDPHNNPHVTIEIENSNAVQVKGKQNKYPEKKFQIYVDEFLHKNMIQNYEPLRPNNQEDDEQSQIDLVTNSSTTAAVLIGIANSPTLDPEVQKHLSQSRYRDVRSMLGKNSSATPEIQKELATDKEWQVRRWLAENPELTLDVQKILVNDSNVHARRWLAVNPILAHDLQKILVNDLSDGVRKKLALNPSITLEVQMVLSNDENQAVRMNLALNPSITPEVQMVLSNDENQVVRMYLVKNPNIPPEVQMVLANDEDPFVRKDLALNSNITPELQRILANAEDPYVRRNLALNPNITPEAQHILVNDESEVVRKMIASNPILTPEAQMVLTNDEEGARFRLTDNPNLHPDVQMALANDVSDEVRIALAKNPNIPPEAQRILVNDVSDEVRITLAKNPRITPAVIKKLASDHNKRVQYSIKTNPRYQQYFNQQESRTNKYSLKYLYEMNTSP